MKTLWRGWLVAGLAVSVWLALPVAAQEGAASTPEVESEEESGESPAARFRRPVVIDTVRWSPAEDQNVTLVYSNQLKVTAPDYASLEAAKPGEVVALTQCAAPKLRTDVNLRFGETVVETGNVAEDYPGVYSLWLERTSDGWNLVFNWKADIWGTMHDPSADVHKVPLKYEHRDAEAAEIAKILLAEEKPKDVPRFKVTFTEENGVVQVDMEWGSHHWSTSFSAA